MPNSDAPIHIPMRYIRAVISAAEARGLSRSDMLRTAEISETELCQLHAHTSVEQYSGLWTVISRELPDTLLGLLLAQPVRAGAAEIMCRACCTAGTLEESLSIVAKALTSISSFDVRLISGELGPRLIFSAWSTAESNREFAFEIIVMTTYSMLSWLTAQRLPLLSSVLPIRDAHHLSDVASLLPGQISSGRSQAALQFAPTVATIPIRRHAAEIAQFISNTPGSYIEALSARGEVATVTRDLQREALPHSLSLTDVAARLSISPRTLHRKLQEEGECFQSIKDSLRRDIAVQALRRTQTPIKQIAVDVGFSDQAAFQRAFAQWTGLPPGAFRRSNGTKPMKLTGS